MAKDGVLEWDGEVLEALPAGFFKVRLKDVDTLARCKKSGKMNMSHISIIPGDWVKIEVNQYDMTQGRIVYRYNDYKNTEHKIADPKPIESREAA